MSMVSSSCGYAESGNCPRLSCSAAVQTGCWDGRQTNGNRIEMEGGSQGALGEAMGAGKEEALWAVSSWQGEQCF